MYKVTSDLYIRCIDDLNFIVSRKGVIDKNGKQLYENLAYLSTVHYLNRYCVNNFKSDMFQELVNEFDNAIEKLTLNEVLSFEIDGIKLHVEIETNDGYSTYKSFVNDALQGYHPNLRLTIKNLLTVYIARSFKAHKDLGEIIKGIKGV